MGNPVSRRGSLVWRRAFSGNQVPFEETGYLSDKKKQQPLTETLSACLYIYLLFCLYEDQMDQIDRFVIYLIILFQRRLNYMMKNATTADNVALFMADIQQVVSAYITDLFPPSLVSCDGTPLAWLASLCLLDLLVQFVIFNAQLLVCIF